jgi:Flp pilus assembly protein TadD
MALRAILMGALLTGVLLRGEDAARPPAGLAYQALQENKLDEAVSHFREAVRTAPTAALHKDLAYTLLRTGDRAEALASFEAALRLDPADERTSLEFAFLAFELQRPRDARRVFDRLRSSADAAVSQAAQTAFENIDRPLREGIARWQSAVAAAPDQWSAHEELARLAFRRDEFPLAESHFRTAFRLKPDRREILLELALSLRAAGQEREALACLWAISRAPEPRLAERARQLLPARYPYVYEFDDAIAIDPHNAALRAEKQELLVAMGLRAAASPDAKTMGLQSLERSYLNDALRYLRIAQEEAPEDAEVALKLGYTLNLLKRDREALAAFDRARQLGNPEAARAYRSLRASSARFHLQAWALPVYSSRWQDLFAYGQVKGEWKAGPVRPYLSLRINGDVRGSRPGAFGPLYLSENALIAAAGLGAPLPHSVYLWAEAGQSFSTRGSRPDFRGGLSTLRYWKWARRAFHESALDAVFLSRFDNNLLTYSQNRTGFRLAASERGLQVEAYLNTNLTLDARRQAWANFAEFGPGLKARWPGLPAGMSFRADFLRGVYTRNQGNIHAPNFWDFRAGVWYALAR